MAALAEVTEPNQPVRLAGIELGGTKCVIVLGADEHIVDRVQIPTTTHDETLQRATSVLSHWHDAAPLEAIGIASFGPIELDAGSPDFGTILATPKPGWVNAPVLATFGRAFDCPICVDTDVNAAALAELAYGAARGSTNAVYITIGTGLGGGVVIEGQPVHGRLHPEIGHIRLRRASGDTFPGVCPYHGDCIEGLIAGPALTSRLPRPPDELGPDDSAWDAVGHDLAQLLACLMLTLSPERIVLGGGVVIRQPHLLDRARAKLPALLAGYLGNLDSEMLDSLIRPAELGDEAGPTGALILASKAISSLGAVSPMRTALRLTHPSPAPASLRP